MELGIGLGTAVDWLKDLWRLARYGSEDMVITMSWLGESGVAEKAKARGLVDLGFAHKRRVDLLKAEGRVIVFEYDKLRRVRRRLVLHDGSVLVGRKIYLLREHARAEAARSL